MPKKMSSQLKNPSWPKKPTVHKENKVSICTREVRMAGLQHVRTGCFCHWIIKDATQELPPFKAPGIPPSNSNFVLAEAFINLSPPDSPPLLTLKILPQSFCR